MSWITAIRSWSQARRIAAAEARRHALARRIYRHVRAQQERVRSDVRYVVTLEALIERGVVPIWARSRTARALDGLVQTRQLEQHGAGYCLAGVGLQLGHGPRDAGSAR